MSCIGETKITHKQPPATTKDQGGVLATHNTHYSASVAQVPGTSYIRVYEAGGRNSQGSWTSSIL